MYKVTATVRKNNQSPASITKVTDKKMTKSDLIKLYSTKTDDYYKNKVIVEDFKCVKAS